MARFGLHDAEAAVAFDHLVAETVEATTEREAGTSTPGYHVPPRRESGAHRTRVLDE